MTAVDPRPPAPDLVDSAAAGPAAMRGGLLRAAGFSGTLLLGLASAPLLIRHLGDVEFGRYSTALAVVAISAGLTEGGVTTVALRELSATRDRDAARRLMRDLLGLRIALGAVAVALAVAYAAIAGYGAGLVAGVLLAGIGMFLIAVQALLGVVLQSRLRFGWVALIEFGRGLVWVALIVALVLAGGGVNAFLALAIPAGLAALVATVVLVRHGTSLRPAFAPGRWSALLRDVLVIALAIALHALYLRVTLLVTSLVSDPQQTGYFAISFRLMEALIGIPALLVGAAFPIISRAAGDDRARFDYATRRIYELCLLLGGLLATGLLLSAPFAIELLAGSDDHPSVEVLQIQAAALLAGFVIAATSFPLLALRRHRELLICNGATLLVALALALALAPSHGAAGAAAAAVGAELVLAGLTTAMLLRRGGPPLPLSAIAVTLAAGLSACLVGRLVGVHPLVAAVAGCATFLAVLALAGRFPPELLELLRSRRVRHDR